MILHPIEALDQVIAGYESYLRTEFRARDPELRRALEEALARSAFLAQEPYFSAHRPFLTGKAWNDLPLDARLAQALAARAGGELSFQHQEEAIEHLLGSASSPLVVSTGTGSGKSECFIAPVLQAAIDDAVTQQKRPGMVALLLYPMNALANDQLERIKSYLATSGWDGSVNVQMYNRGTTEAERAAMREHPPHILLTNYQMLEYLLVRPADREALFRGHRLRFLVLDEVHTYRGTLGTHVALLLRRLKAHLRKAAPDRAEPIAIGTSATIKSDDGAGQGGERDRAVQAFFSRLVGIADSQRIRVVGEAREDVAIPESSTLCTAPLPASLLLESIDPANLLEATAALAGRSTGDHSLEALAAQARIFWLLNQWLGVRPMSLSQLEALARREVQEWMNWTDGQIRQTIMQALRIGSALPESCADRLRLRTHRFVRGGWIFQRCIDPSCGRLYPRGESMCQCGKPTAPLLLCRSCGADFLEMRGTMDGEGKLVPAFSNVPGQALLDESDPDDTPRKWWLFRPDHWVWKLDEGDDELEPEDEGDLPAPLGKRGARVQLTGADRKSALLEGCYDMSQQTFLVQAGGTEKLVPSKKICPGCQGRGGVFDVITPVSLGTSAATKVLTEELLEALPTPVEDPKKRLLVFADSRQDAAHQARFISFTARFDRMRMRVVSILNDCVREGSGPLTFQTLVQKLGERAVLYRDNPRLPSTGMPRGDDRYKVWAYEEAPLLEDFALNRRFRASLESLGLVEVSYEGVSDVVADMLPYASQLGLESNPSHLAFAINRLLDLFRQSGAFHRDMLRYHTGYLNYPETLKAADWSRRFGTVTGLPADESRKMTLHQSGDVPRGVSVRPVWHAGKGARPGPEKLFIHLASRLGEGYRSPGQLQESGFVALIESLVERGLLIRDKLYGYNNQPIELYQVNDAGMMIALASHHRRARCNQCSLVICGEGVIRMPCPRCSGTLGSFGDEEVLSNRYALRASQSDAVALVAREHTAQVTTDARKEIEENFKSKNDPTNVLACSPTLEMGIDVGGLDAVLLRNVPPRPDNYAQRGGRAGRRSRVGLVLSYTRNTPHDQYFFEHADEMITGEVPAPAFSLGNRDIVARHVLAIAFGLAEPGLASRMNEYVTFGGEVRLEQADELKAGLTAVQNQAVRLALDAFGEDVLVEAGYDVTSLDRLLSALPERVQDAFMRTAVQVQKLRSAIQVSYETGMGMPNANRSTALINKLLGNVDPKSSRRADDSSGAYPLRRLAEFGILPGYEFPAEPASVRLLSDRDEEQPVTASRSAGLRQYQPGAPVYARGKKWEVFGIDLSSPWNPQGKNSATDSFGYLRCANCNLIRSESVPSCPRCHVAQAAREKTAMAYAGFVARPNEGMAASEEDRTSARDNVELHPSWQAERLSGRWDVADSSGWRWEWRQGETVYWLNEGNRGRDGTRELFPICSECGRLISLPAGSFLAGRTKKGQVAKAPAKSSKSDSLGHNAACPNFGQEVDLIALYAEGKVETLRLIIPWPEKRTDARARRELESWGWSLGYALLAGAEKYFALASGDLEVLFEGVCTQQKPAVTEGSGGNDQGSDVVLTFIDPNVGGSGYLKKLATDMQHVAAAALKHLDHADCETSCYRCLRSYSNQRYHTLLNWQCVTGALEGLANSTTLEVDRNVRDVGDPLAWQEAFAAGCGSPLELKALRLMEGEGFAPDKQYGIVAPNADRPFTIPDFAFVNERVAIYIDGVAYHSGDRLRRDRAIDLSLMQLGWRVMRFTARDLAQGKLTEAMRLLQPGSSDLSTSPPSGGTL